MLCFPEAAGEPYCPSNSTSGEIFMEEFCYKCIYDNYSADLHCGILTKTMLHNIEDPEYPKEWVYDKDGYPICTKFEEE